MKITISELRSMVEEAMLDEKKKSKGKAAAKRKSKKKARRKKRKAKKKSKCNSCSINNVSDETISERRAP